MLQTQTAGSAVSRRGLAVLGAAALGLVLVLGTGLAPSQLVHNAAHDARHAAAFPCH